MLDCRCRKKASFRWQRTIRLDIGEETTDLDVATFADSRKRIAIEFPTQVGGAEGGLEINWKNANGALQTDYLRPGSHLYRAPQGSTYFVISNAPGVASRFCELYKAV